MIKLAFIGGMLMGIDVVVTQLAKKKRMAKTSSASFFSLSDADGNELRFMVTPMHSVQYDAFVPAITPILEKDWRSIIDCPHAKLVRAFDLLANCFTAHFITEMGPTLIDCDGINKFFKSVDLILKDFVTNGMSKVLGYKLRVIA